MFIEKNVNKDSTSRELQNLSCGENDELVTSVQKMLITFIREILQPYRVFHGITQGPLSSLYT